MATFGFIEYTRRQPRGAGRLRRHHGYAQDRLDQQFLEGARARSRVAKRTWESIKQIMAPGALDPLTKELIYVAVSVSNQCATASRRTLPRRARAA